MVLLRVFGSVICHLNFVEISMQYSIFEIAEEIVVDMQYILQFLGTGYTNVSFGVTHFEVVMTETGTNKCSGS